MLLKAAVVIQLIPFIYLFLGLMKTHDVSMAAPFCRRRRTADDAGGTVRGFSADVRRLECLGLRGQSSSSGVVGPTALGWFLFWRARETSATPSQQVA